jgi:hypothetical protein
VLALDLAQKEAPYEAVLSDSFDGPDFSPAGGLYYKDNAEQRAGRVEFQREVTRSPGGALKLTVEGLCKSEQTNCSERAEIWEKPELRVPYDRGVWYGFAVRFGDPVPQDDHRYLIAQWKREIGPTAIGDFSPFLALRLRNGHLFATVETNLLPATRVFPKGEPARCAEDETAVWLRPETNQTRALVAASEGWKPEEGKLFNACTDRIRVVRHGPALPRPQDGWIDFVVYTRPGPDGSGRIELFANSRHVVTVTGAIGHADPGLGEHQYFKFGPYRAAKEGAWTVYYDDFRRSLDCGKVLEGAPCPE